MLGDVCPYDHGVDPVVVEDDTLALGPGGLYDKYSLLHAAIFFPLGFGLFWCDEVSLFCFIYIYLSGFEPFCSHKYFLQHLKR